MKICDKRNIKHAWLIFIYTACRNVARQTKTSGCKGNTFLLKITKFAQQKRNNVRRIIVAARVEVRIKIATPFGFSFNFF